MIDAPRSWCVCVDDATRSTALAAGVEGASDAQRSGVYHTRASMLWYVLLLCALPNRLALRYIWPSFSAAPRVRISIPL